MHAIAQLFDSFRSVAENYGWDESNSYALPDAALEFVVSVASRLGAQKIFEFGSGRSTAALLDAGFEVASIEDDAAWLAKTARSIRHPERHFAFCVPLSLRWHQAAPFRAWTLPADARRRLAASDLVLIDSPAYAPFREAVLMSALTQAPRAVVILDDTRVPTLARFCDRIAARNPGLLHARVPIGHGMDIFHRQTGATLCLSRPPLEFVRAWRRFIVSR